MQNVAKTPTTDKTATTPTEPIARVASKLSSMGDILDAMAVDLAKLQHLVADLDGEANEKATRLVARVTGDTGALALDIDGLVAELRTAGAE